MSSRRIASVALIVAACAFGVPAAAHAQSGGCLNRVTFGLVDARTAGCLVPTGNGTWQSTDTVTLNGLALPVAPGTKLILRAPDSDSPGGSISVNTNITVQGVTLEHGLLKTDFPAGGKGDEKDVATFDPQEGQELFGLPIAGNAALRLGYGTDERRYALFRVVVKLPDLFKSGTSPDAGGLTSTIGVRVDDRGVRTDAVKVELAHAYIGQLEVRSVCLSYTAAGTTTTTPCEPPPFGAQPLLDCAGGTDQSRWDGSAEVVLPTESHAEVGVFAGLRGNAFSYAGAQVASLGNSVPLAQGVYLDKVGLAICVNPPPLKFKGAAGIRFGPPYNGTQAAYLDGTILYTDTRPWTIEAGGGLSLYGRQVANGRLRYESSGAIDFGFDANFDFSLATVSGNVNGWIEARQPVRFDVSGGGQVCVKDVACSSGDIDVSSLGTAGCFTLAEFPYAVLVEDDDWVWYKPWRTHWETRTKRLRAGAGYTWSNGRLDVMGDSCDIGGYREVRLVRLSAAQNGFSLEVPREPGVTFRIQGTEAPPRVELTGPDGRVIRSPATGGQLVRGGHATVPDAAHRSTAVLVVNPAPGTWRVTALPGSPRIERVDLAQTHEAPTIAAAVGGHGRRRALGYAVATDPTRPITFIEEGPHSLKVLGQARGKPCPHQTDGPQDRGRPRCGALRFTPADGPGGKRRIYAETEEEGVPVQRQLVTTYTAAPEPHPNRARFLELRRRRGAVVASWGDGPGVDRWQIRITYQDGRRLLEVHGRRRRRLVVRGVGRQAALRVSVVGVREDSVEGRPVSAKLRRKQASVRVPRR